MSRPLRDRVSCGEVAAFLDPALPLELLTEPNADWFSKGCLVFMTGLLRARELNLRVWGFEESLRAGLSIIHTWGFYGGVDVWASLSPDEQAAMTVIDRYLHLPVSE